MMLLINSNLVFHLSACELLVISVDTWYKRNYNSMLVPFSMYWVFNLSLNLLGYLEGQDSCYSSLNNIMVLRKNSNNSSRWSPKLSKYMKQKTLKPLIAISLERISSYEYFYKCVLNSHQSVAFTNIPVLKWARKHLFNCDRARAVSILKLSKHKAYLPCPPRWQQSSPHTPWYRRPQEWETPRDPFPPCQCLFFAFRENDV